MVVKWSADKDQFILNHLLTDTSIKINNDVLDAMIQTWPATFGAAPTRKALTEHFGKIRKTSKALVAGDGTIPSTPATTTAKKTKTPATKSTATKRKKPIITTSDESDNNSAPPTKTPAKRRKLVTADEDEDADMQAEMAELGVRIKDEPVDEDTPSKKPAPRRGNAAKVPKYTDDDEDAGGHPEEDADNGSEDEYVDKEVVEKMSAYLDAPDDEDEAEV